MNGMPKILILALAISLSTPVSARTNSEENAANIVNRANRGKGQLYDRQALTRAINETMVIIEDLSRRLKHASKEEADEVWASGTRDFKLGDGEVTHARKACESMLRAFDHESKASEYDESKAKSLREDARDQMRRHHKRKSEEYVRDLRNWLSISEGALRKTLEKRGIKP